MNTTFRASAMLVLCLLSGQSLDAQVRTLGREPSLKTLAPIATATLAALGGNAVLGKIVVRASAHSVHVSDSGGLIGGGGQLVMTAPYSPAGYPGSMLHILSDSPPPAGAYAVSVAFTHAKAGDTVRITDQNTGVALATCTLVQKPNYDDTQTCDGGFQLSGAKIQILVEATVGAQVFPTQVTVSQLQG